MLIDPMYKRIDKMGSVYVDRNLAEQEILIVVIKPKPETKIDYIKVGRGTQTLGPNRFGFVYKNINMIWVILLMALRLTLSDEFIYIKPYDATAGG